MKIVATSDFHGHLPEIPECDLLLIAGDICPVWDHERSFQAEWLRTEFSEWMMNTPAEEVVWVGGNHDFILQEMKRSKIDKLPGYYLNNDYVISSGLKVWGSPMSPTFGGWAFMEDDIQLFDKWKLIHEDTDILVVHGPPLGYGDLTQGWMGSPPEHVGSRTLRDRLVDLPNIKAVVCGHIHPAYGVYETLNGQKVYNATHVNEQYKPVNPPIIFEI